MFYQSTVTTKGQVTIPAEIRKALGLKPGDRVSFGLEDHGIRVEPAKGSVRAGYGAAKLTRKFKSIKQLRKETREWVSEQALKEM